MPDTLVAQTLYPRRFRRLLSSVARASQPDHLPLHVSSNGRFRFGSLRSALHRLAPATTMASADFCFPIPTPLDVSSPRQGSRSPGVRRVTFAPYTRRIYAQPVRVTSGFGSYGLLAHLMHASMRFLFVRPELCLQLPSHPASRRRGCCSARGSCHRDPQRTFTSKSLPGSLSLGG